MATGDNVLTAISVGRQCNIINAEAEVFLGDVKRDKATGLEFVYWKSTRGSAGADENVLNAGTLLPEHQDLIHSGDMKKPGYTTVIRSELELSI